MTASDSNTSEESIRFERIGRHIALVTLNRPQARNAINAVMTLRLEELVRSIDSDPELRVALQTSRAQ